MVVSLEIAFFEAMLEIFPIYFQIKHMDFLCMNGHNVAGPPKAGLIEAGAADAG
jgi:hypothetical protein